MRETLWYLRADIESFYDNECRAPDEREFQEKYIEEFSDAYILAMKLGFRVKEDVQAYIPFARECGVPFEN